MLPISETPCRARPGRVAGPLSECPFPPWPGRAERLSWLRLFAGLCPGPCHGFVPPEPGRRLPALPADRGRTRGPCAPCPSSCRLHWPADRSSSRLRKEPCAIRCRETSWRNRRLPFLEPERRAMPWRRCRRHTLLSSWLEVDACPAARRPPAQLRGSSARLPASSAHSALVCSRLAPDSRAIFPTPQLSSLLASCILLCLRTSTFEHLKSQLGISTNVAAHYSAT